MDIKNFFMNPKMTSQRQYEALRCYYLKELSADQVAQKFNFSPKYFKKLRFEFSKKLRDGKNPFFVELKPGPKKRHTDKSVKEKIIALRKQNYAVTDIKVALDAEGKAPSIETIDNILKDEGFAPLPRRTHKERFSIKLPQKIEPPRSGPLEIINEEFTTEVNAGPLIFLPLLEELEIIPAIKTSGFPQTNEISDVQSILSFLALKIIGCKRWSHDTAWNMDRALGFFAGLNVLPKCTTLSTYSYRTKRSNTRNLLTEMSRIFREDKDDKSEFNLDFKSIPHWGDASVLERNWSGSRNKSIKSLLSLIVQNPSTGNLVYTNAEIKHLRQKDAVFDFIDFWQKGSGKSPNMLIFDSKFTTYKNLNDLNQSKKKILFLTLRRRGKKLIEKAEKLSPSKWERIGVKRAGGKLQMIRVNDDTCRLKGYEGNIRQVIIKDHGRKKPSFLITNDLELDVRKIVEKYARRWLVEQEIAEQIAFFSLNNPSSSIVVKVDFDLMISLLAHNLYRIIADNLSGFENCTAPTINRKFIENGAIVNIKGNDVFVHLKKKTHLPLLFELPWMKKPTKLSWMGLKIHFLSGSSS